MGHTLASKVKKPGVMTRHGMQELARLAVIYYEDGALASAIKILYEIAGKEQTREPLTIGFDRLYCSSITVQRRIR